MNYKEAIKILELQDTFGENEIRRAYYKKALKYHPDRYKDDNGYQFKQVHEAYDFLQTRYNRDAVTHDNIDNVSTNVQYNTMEHFKMSNATSYVNLITQYIQQIMKKINYDDVFLESIFKIAFNDCKKISISLFKKLSREKAEKMYEFLSQHKEILHIEEDLMIELSKILVAWHKSDNLVILNPDIDNLLNDEIYKLTFNDNTYFIPLWHPEIIYDENDETNADIIVKMMPDLSNNITIDELNNIHIEWDENIVDILQDEKLTVNIGKKKFEIPSNEIKVSIIQVIKIPNKGILNADSNDLYNTKNRGHIYVHLTLHTV